MSKLKANVTACVSALVLIAVVSGLPYTLLTPVAMGKDDATSNVFLPLVVGGPRTSSSTATSTPTATPTSTPPTQSGILSDPLVFVSRQIPDRGSVYWDVPKGMPGVGTWSRFQVASPGKLLIFEPNGNLRVLIDGSDPRTASLNLIDVNAPSVSYDGKTIVFAGLPNGNYDRGTTADPGAWRIFTIGADGNNLRQLTFSDQTLDLSQFGDAASRFVKYDDTDSVWLPDGRIVFSSTRWPSIAQYSGVRSTNLFVVHADGTNLHRITAERNGADRPLVDPVTGKVVFARWWRNHRFAVNSMETILSTASYPKGGYFQHEGLTTDRSNHVGGADNLWRNFWQIASIKPDGTGVAQWTGAFRGEPHNHWYGGAFTYDGALIANFFPMFNMTEAAGFGGLRRFHRGPGTYDPIVGISGLTLEYVHPESPTSYGIFVGEYASEPDVLPDGRIVFSLASDINQDYGLYLMNADGSNRQLLYDNPGTTELRARVLRSRPLPPVIPDEVTQTASLLPPLADGPYDVDGTFVFDALNVYFNAPVDVPIVNAPPVGSAARIRFYIDHQRTSSGSFPTLDWPILLAEQPVNADGSVRNPAAPANVPLFEQLRSADGTVPVTFDPRIGNTGGAAHVAGMNYGRPGEVSRCVGCHAGHTMISVPSNDVDAQWTNLAPGAEITVSSSRDPKRNQGLIDRRVMTGEIWRYWNSASGATQNQWVQLTFQVPVTVRTVRLYNPRTGDEANSSIQVQSATVRLYSDTAGAVEVANNTTGSLSVSGTDVAFNDVKARVVRVEISSVTGTFYGIQLASLAEVEVIARGESSP